MKEIKELLVKIHQKYQPENNGKLASYIPELALANSNHFALAIVNTKGEMVSVGDDSVAFTLQSTSKPFVYGLALRELGLQYVHSRVGVEPTGEAFNSIIELEEKSHRPFNPMINSGAIAIASLLKGDNFSKRLGLVKGHFEDYVGHTLSIDEKVYESERGTAHRNRAIAYLMKHFNVIESDIEETLDLYFKQCSVLVTCRDLAMMAGTLANSGVHPVTLKRVLDSNYVSNILSLIFTCGMYDSAGEWAFEVGVPSKSGVSGAIFSVVPGRFGIAAFSPLVDSRGHSVRGALAIKELSKELHLSIFKNEG